MQRILSVLLALLLFPTAGFAQDGTAVTLSGQIRHRSELDARDLDASTTAADYHLLRTRLNAFVQPVDRVEVFAQVQDSRLFGGGDAAQARGTMDPSAGQFDLHQAYFTVNGLFDTGLSLKVGRQELVYGNQRLVGSVGWSNVGRTFDAGVLAYESARASVDVFAAKLVGTTAEDAGAQNFYGLFSSWTVAEGQTLDLFALLDNNTDAVSVGGGDTASRLVRVTPGLALRGAADRFHYELEAAYQAGKQAITSSADRATIRASLLSATGRYVLVPARGLSLGGGYTRLSGDDDPDDDTLGQFNTLFATNHKFYGFMDYFPSMLGSMGLQDTQITSTVRVSEKTQLAAAFHHFALAEPVPNTSLQQLGQELDLTTTYRFAENVTFVAGLSGFFPNEAMEAPRGDDTAYWGYLMSVINF